MLRFDGGDARRVDTAHLPGTHAYCLAIGGVNDGIGLDEFRYFPGEQQVLHLLIGRLYLAGYLQVGSGNHAKVTILHQQSAVNALVIQCGTRRGPFTTGQQPHIFFPRYCCSRLVADTGGDDDFHELPCNDSGGSRRIQFPVEGDDAAKG